ncbi:LCP family protein [Nesterenkonia suensis]
MAEQSVSPPRPRRRNRRRIVVGVVLGSLVVLLGGALIASLVYLNSLSRSYEDNVQTFTEEDTFPEESRRPAKEDDSVNILLIGSDEHGGSGESEDLPRVPQGGRSDTMMLVHIPDDRDSVQVMSIPRDLWVEVPDHGWHKVNAPLALGGISLTVDTLEELFDVRIDHIASVDMLGFIGLVDSLGGVAVDSSYPEAFTTGEGYTFEPGTQHMDSEEALSFVRHRATFPDGDLQRVRNQQAFIRAVIQESLAPSNLSNPGQVQDMVETFSPHLVVDQTLDSSTVASLAWRMRGATGDIQLFTLPTGDSGRSPDGQWIWHQDTEVIAEISEALKDGTLQEYVDDHDL